MLGNKKNKKMNIIFLSSLVFVCFSFYFYWSGAADDSQLVSLNDKVSGVGDETLQLLSELKTLKLDEDIFDDKAFQSLEDFSMEISPRPSGRNNPFAIVGTDGVYQGEEEIASTTSDGTE